MYEFATGLIRVLEKRLPDKTDIERMTLARNAGTAFDVLGDTDYADNIADRAPEEYAAVLEEDTKQLTTLLKGMLGSSALFDFLFIEFDFLNTKILLKQKYLKAVAVDLSSNAVSNPKKLQAIIEYAAKEKSESEATVIPLEIQAILLNINPLFYQAILSILNYLNNLSNLGPAEIDTATDKELLKTKQKIAQNINDTFIKNLLQLQIDFLNVKILLRNKKSQSKKMLEFIAGGRLDKEQLLHLYNSDEPILFENLKEIFEWYKISDVISQYKEFGQLAQIEHDLAQAEYNFISTNAKQAASGIAVVVGYFMEKMNGARNVRTIMAGKLNGIDIEEIKKKIIL